MKFVLALAILLSCSLSFALTYKCDISQYPDGKTKNAIWAGELILKNKDSASVNIIADGKGITLEEVFKNIGNDTQEQRMSKYDGKMAIGLNNADNVLKLSQGTVDSKNKENMAPHEAFAWADINAKKIGVKNIQKNILVECVKK